MTDKNFIGFGLHDAVLRRIIVDWVKDTATIHLSAVVPEKLQVVITAIGLVELTCSKRFPWGLGDNILYVNDVSLIEDNDGHKLQFEMSSGDVLTLIASRIEKMASVSSDDEGTSAHGE